MPYIHVATNQELDDKRHRELCTALTELAAELLGKSTAYVMVQVEPGVTLSFGGTFDPAAFVQLKSIRLDTSRCAELSAAICTFLQASLGIPPDRAFIDFIDLTPSQFGWNSKVF